MTSNYEAGTSDQKQNVERIEDAPKQAHDGRGKDRAAELLNNTNERIVLSEADNKRILRKIDLTILPIMLGVYFLQQLDKSTLSYASVFGLVEDAHLKGEDYSWLGSIVYIAQLVMQPLIAYVLVKLPTGKFAGDSDAAEHQDDEHGRRFEDAQGSTRGAGTANYSRYAQRQKLESKRNGGCLGHQPQKICR